MTFNKPFIKRLVQIIDDTEKLLLLGKAAQNAVLESTNTSYTHYWWDVPECTDSTDTS